MNIIYTDSTSLLMLNNHEDVIDIIISWSQLELITQHMNIIYTDSTSQLMLNNHEDVTDIIQVFINSFSTRKYSSRCPNGTKMTGEKSHECTSFRWSTTHWERQIFGVCCDQMLKKKKKGREHITWWLGKTQWHVTYCLDLKKTTIEKWFCN